MAQHRPVLAGNSLTALGARLAMARKAREMTQADLAHCSDVGISTIASLEAGHHGVSLGNFLKVMSGLNLLGQVNDWLDPAKDPEVIAFATRRLSDSRR